MFKHRGVATVLAAAVGALGVTAAQAQRYAPQEADRSNMSCTQLAQLCKRRQAESVCESQRQGCMQTGTWQGAQELSRNVQRR